MAVRLPPVTFEDREEKYRRVAVFDQTGAWVDEGRGARGFESDFLGRVATDSPPGVWLSCERGLAKMGSEFGWKSRRRADLDSMRSLAALSILDGWELKERLPLPAVDQSIDLAIDLRRWRPWTDPTIVANPWISVEVTDAPGTSPRCMSYQLRITPPTNHCDSFWLSFRRAGADPLVFSVGDSLVPDFLGRFLDACGLEGQSPSVYAESPKERPRPPTAEELLLIFTMTKVVANVREKHGLLVADGRVGEQRASAFLTPTPGAVHPQAFEDGRIGFIVSTDGKPVPEDGYDDCPVCLAQREELRRRKLN